jgi:hypothetical protein
MNMELLYLMMLSMKIASRRRLMRFGSIYKTDVAKSMIEMIRRHGPFKAGEGHMGLLMDFH